MLQQYTGNCHRLEQALNLSSVTYFHTLGLTSEKFHNISKQFLTEEQIFSQAHEGHLYPQLP